MKQVLKRDWEIVRIFLILAILTLGFVWVMQSLILTPSTSPQLRSRGSQASSYSEAESAQEEAVLGKIGFTVSKESPAQLLPIPLRIPAGESQNPP